MADASATFTVEIGSTGGDDAASSLEQLRAKILADTAALKQMQTALRNLKGGTSTDIAAFKQLQQQITAQKASIANSQAAYVKLGGTFDGLKDSTEEGSGGIEEFQGALQRLGPAARLVNGHLGQMLRLLGRGGTVGLAIAAAVVVALLATAIISATVAILRWGIGLADANRNSDLMIQGLEASSKGLQRLGSILPSIQRQTGLSTEELAKMAQQLDEAGIKAADLPDALKALAFATQGGASAAYLKKLNAELAAGTKNVKQIAAEVEGKFGKNVAEKLLSLDAQFARFKENISGKNGIFSSLNIEPFLKGLQKLIGLFDQSSSTGRALKSLFELIFQPILDGATRAIPVLAVLFKQTVIYALEAYIAVRKLGKAFDIKGSEVGFFIVFGILGAIAGVAALVGVVILSIAAAVAFVASPFIALGYVIYAAVDAIIDGFESAYDYLSSVDLMSVGTAMIQGLANGITSAAGAVLDAITGAVGGAINAAKSMLGIHSPSRVFAQLGGHTAEGFAQGIDAGSDRAAGASADMATASIVAASDVGGGGSLGGCGPITIQQVLIQGVQGADDPGFVQKVVDAFQSALSQAGLATT